MTVKEVMRLWLQKDVLNFTRRFFVERTGGQKFVIGQHHRMICDKLNDVLNGKCNRLIINIAPRYGKSIDVNTPMLTSCGWKKASEIRCGDYLYARNGKKTKVLNVYPQGITSAYKVTFTDGSSLVTCGEHLWQVHKRERHPKGNYWVVRRTKEMVGSLYQPDGHRTWNIPMCEPLEGEESNLPIDPYLLGCWLGDGSTHKAEITTMDEEIIRAFESYGYTKRTHLHAGKATEYGIVGSFVTQLKNIGILHNKRIPTKYMLASKEQRIELLKGLCDTDGTCNRKNGQVSICSTNAVLKEDIRTLLSSLGMYCTEYRNSLFFRSPICPFKLIRKAKYWKPINKHHFTKRFISSIEPVTERETVCFEVDNEEHLYLAGKDLIVTHNTELAVKNFIAAGLAINPAAKFIHLSYSENLALDSSTAIKDIINIELFKDLFNARVKKGSDTKSRWDTIQGGGVYATSTLGQITGFGAGCVDSEDGKYRFGGALVIDDPIKPEDALSDVMREAVNRRFETTIRSRVNSRNTPIIIIMQRLHERDLCGYLIDKEPDKWEVLSLPCLIQDEETGEEKALWAFKDTVDELHDRWEADAFVFQTQYQQNAKPVEGQMYTELRTYESLPITDIPPVRKNYTDTADTGADYHCSIDYLEYPTGMYIIDVLYTDKPMEFTEPEQARMMNKDGIELSNIESNNGGRGFARNVEKNLRLLRNTKTVIRSLAQNANKESRIFTHAVDVQNLIYFPEGWQTKWSKFYAAIAAYRKSGKNAHDDAPDCLTGMVEHFNAYETDEDPAALVNYEAVMDLFETEDKLQQEAVTVLSAGIAAVHDRFIAIKMIGNIAYVAINRMPMGYEDAELQVLTYIREHNIPQQFTVVDTDGSQRPIYLNSAKAFYAGDKPKDSVFDNIRSESYFKLAKLINDRKIHIVCNNETKKDFLEEFRIMRKLRSTNDGSRKSAVIGLDVMHDILGRTPDLMEALAKAMVFRDFSVREEASVNVRTFRNNE